MSLSFSLDLEASHIVQNFDFEAHLFFCKCFLDVEIATTLTFWKKKFFYGVGILSCSVLSV